MSSACVTVISMRAPTGVSAISEMQYKRIMTVWRQKRRAIDGAGTSAEPDASRPGRETDQPRILDRRLPVFDRLAVDGIADHGDEGGDARRLSDERKIPAFLR